MTNVTEIIFFTVKSPRKYKLNYRLESGARSAVFCALPTSNLPVNDGSTFVLFFLQRHISGRAVCNDQRGLALVSRQRSFRFSVLISHHVYLAFPRVRRHVVLTLLSGLDQV